MAAPTDAVLVGVGSERNLPVVRLAAQEAAAHDRPLHLMHAFDWAGAFEAQSVAGPRAEAEDLISRATATANEVEPALRVSGEIVEGGPVPALVRRSETAFLVAVGDGGMATCATCGVPPDAPAVQLAARAGSPVLVARRDPPPQGPVLVGVDGSASSQRAARLLVVRVVEEDESDDPDLLAGIVARCGERHPEVSAECHTVLGDPSTVLVEQSRSAQLSVVAARGDDPWRGMLGAVSQSLLYHAPSPVIVVRGMAADAGDGT
jgi:nucleotide-binding universal stress UspA family protein